MTPNELRNWSIDLLWGWLEFPPKGLTKAGWEMIHAELARRGELEAEVDTQPYTPVGLDEADRHDA